MKIYLYCKTRVFTQDEIDALLTVFHGSIMNRIKLMRKRILLSFKNIICFRLILIRSKFVYIIGLGEFKKELSEDSYYTYFISEEEPEENYND